MNRISKIQNRPLLSLPFGASPRQVPCPTPAGTLSRMELQRIVAAMLG